jgi:hypothetical protein
MATAAFDLGVGPGPISTGCWTRGGRSPSTCYPRPGLDSERGLPRDRVVPRGGRIQGARRRGRLTLRSWTRPFRWPSGTTCSSRSTRTASASRPRSRRRSRQSARGIHLYHVEGCGGGPVNLLEAVSRRTLPSSTSPTVPFGEAAVAEHEAMIRTVHRLHLALRERPRRARVGGSAWTMAAERSSTTSARSASSLGLDGDGPRSAR